MLESFFLMVGQGMVFNKRILERLFKKPYNSQIVADQIWIVIVQSALITAIAGFFVGGIMSIQFSLQMRDFGALGYLGGLATSGTFREVGPLLIAFMLAGKIGAYTSAELGTMAVTEQLDAIRCLGADPIKEIVMPRFVGIILSSFFLLAAGLVMSIFGGLFVGSFFAGVTAEEYLRHIPTILSGYSIFSGIFKCFLFAYWLASVCTFFGFHTTGGAKGVGQSVVKTAVVSMIGLVLMDWLSTFLLESLRQAWMG